MKRQITNFIFLILIGVAANALDFGLVTNQSADLSNNANGDNIFEYSGGFVPRLSSPIGENGNLFVSASFTLKYIDKLEFFPELLRTEYSLDLGAWDLFIGRFNYRDPMSIAVSGLFDGVQVKHTSKIGRFGFGAWYTGLQYKNSAKILMTPFDEASYYEVFDYGKFTETYFSSKRIFAAFDWEHPALGEFLQIKTSLIGQIDLNSNLMKIHSEYLLLNLGIPLGSFFFNAGGVFQAAQTEKEGARDSFFAYAGEVSALYRLPSNFNSSVSVKAVYSSGGADGSYTPVTTQFQGEIFQARMTGLALINLNYSARFAYSVGASLDASYFIRTDADTPNIFPYSASLNEGNLPGAEFFGKFIWSPVSDLQLILGGGTFIPSLGNIWKDDPILWKVNVSAVLGIR